MNAAMNCLECGTSIDEFSKRTGRPKQFCAAKCRNAYNYKLRKITTSEAKRVKYSVEEFIEGRLNPDRIKAIQRKAYDELYTLILKTKDLNVESYEYAKLVVKIIEIARKEDYFLLFDDAPFRISDVRKGLTKVFGQEAKTKLTDDQIMELEIILNAIDAMFRYDQPGEEEERNKCERMARTGAEELGFWYPLPDDIEELETLVDTKLKEALSND